MSYVRWNDIRAAQVERAGGEASVEAGKQELLARAAHLSGVVDVLTVPDGMDGQLVAVEAVEDPVVADAQPTTRPVTHLG